MQTSEVIPNRLVDQAIIKQAAFPAHATDHANGLHALRNARFAKSGDKPPTVAIG
jgi:hypothetical protein